MGDERAGNQSQAWKVVPGGVERMRTEGDKTISERKDIALKFTSTTETYPNALRFTVRAVDFSEGTPAEKAQQKLMVEAVQDKERIDFTDPRQQVRLRLLMGEASEGLIKASIIGGDKDDPANPTQGAAFVNVRYTNGNLTRGSFQGEIMLPKVEPVRPWAETSADFFNYLRSQSPDSVQTLRGENFEELDAAIKGYPLDSRTLHDVGDLYKNLMGNLIGALPQGDQAHARELLSETGWNQLIQARLLEELNKKKIGSAELDRDAFLDTAVDSGIKLLTSPSHFRRVLQVLNFGESDFRWRERSIVSDSPESKTVKQGTDAYGGTIDIQQHKFKIDRSNGVIKVTCYRGDKLEWTSTLPLFIPHDEIVKDFRDLDEDFRKIKPKVDIKFEKSHSSR